jgi:3,4-dihydroxy 2-butanone 4-phosphate synthase/GTP cyclohydrolase II
MLTSESGSVASTADQSSDSALPQGPTAGAAGQDGIGDSDGHDRYDEDIFASVEDAVAAIGRGEIVVVVDDEDRENEGDLIMAAEFATPEALTFFVRHTSGVICAPLTGDRLDELQIPLMVRDNNTEVQRTAFTYSVDYMHGTSTGISAADRALTIRMLTDPATRPNDLARPGHIFPLRYSEGGVLKRAGHTEAAVDLARMAGLYPAGVLCEVVNDDGTMARVPDLVKFCQEHNLLMISIAQMIRYRRRNEKLVRRIAESRIPTPWGDFTCVAYESVLDNEQHIAMVRGTVAGADDVLVRVHSECLTGDIFRSMRCDCGVQLDAAMARVAEEGTGAVVYLRGHEGRGIGIGHKIRAYSLQDEGHDTVSANEALGLPVDSREYGIGAQILNDLGITTMRLMTNNPSKYGGLEGFGLTITDRVPIESAPNDENRRYLETKRDRMGHLLAASEPPAGIATDQGADQAQDSDSEGGR